MRGKKIGYVILFIVSLFISSEISYAAEDVSEWSKLGRLSNEYLLSSNGMAYDATTGEQINMHSDVIQLNYIGQNIKNDVSIDSYVPKINVYENFSRGATLQVKNMGVYKGQLLAIRIKSLSPLLVKIGSERLLNITRKNEYSMRSQISPRIPPSTPDISYTVVDQVTGKPISDNVKTMVTIGGSTNWGDYVYAHVIQKDRPIIALISEPGTSLFRSTIDGENRHIARGGVVGNDSVLFEMGVLTRLDETTEMSMYSFFPAIIPSIQLFDSRTKIKLPRDYSSLSVTSVDNGSGNLEYTIEQELPNQLETAYYPEKLELDYSKEASDLKLSKPIIFSENKTIAATEYNYSNNKVTFPKTFLQKYAGKNIQIKFKSAIDYSTKQMLTYYDKTKRKFNFTLSLKSTSTKNAVSKTEIEVTNNGTVSYPLVLKAEGANKTVALKSSTDNYNAADFITNLSSNFPNDTVVPTFKNKVEFKTEGNVNIPFMLKSGLLGIEKEIIVQANISQPVTGSFFENQAWLIEEINRQLSPKKIDEDLYMSDLLKITSISNRTTASFKGQYIPKTIAALENLEMLELKDKQLSGSLPDELGDMTKLTKLSIFGNSFSGGIPKTLSKLKNLTFLALDDNKLTGTVPSGLEQLPELKQVYLNKNALVGNLPNFSLGPFSNFNISETQLTYNDEVPPKFITKSTQYQDTFVTGAKNLSLKGTEIIWVTLRRPILKPFDSTSEGYLNLHVQKADGTKVNLYSGHTFKIFLKNWNNGGDYLMYDGPADPNFQMVFHTGESYKVVMDNADKNPNNIFEFQPQQRMSMLTEVPKMMTLDLKIGDLSYQPVKISNGESLSIFDNRLNNQWQLKIKTDPIMSKTRRLIGNFYYKGSDGIPERVGGNGSFNLIESGRSNPDLGIIDFTKEWDDNRGLFYKQESTANYKDDYAGKVEWQLVDAPAG
ncbi:hypothetical protein [Candidatus Enterococcus ikei]|uniref:Uncharacterized protein n=1 Tax=Candidatus Enterococcus ikei TaxID=2815326 RepID=A0ABS3H215_9ENTE|nr:hypothetical protein [Enterococcus sp. DIV0869a]MBO0441572.1 hypothetical protein [Enterococcus sp. DIV0869a]